MKILAKLIAVAAAAGAFAASQAQQIRFLTVGPNNAIYEVIPGAPGGGRFINAPRTFLGVSIAGYTDRVKRGEVIGTYIQGTGVFSRVGITANGRTYVSISNVAAPFFNVRMVSSNPMFDNVTVFCDYKGRHYELRVPIGTRP